MHFFHKHVNNHGACGGRRALRASSWSPPLISLGFTFPSLACFYPPHAPWTFCSPHESLQSSSHLLFPPSCCYRVSSSSPTILPLYHPPPPLFAHSISRVLLSSPLLRLVSDACPTNTPCSPASSTFSCRFLCVKVKQNPFIITE